MGERSVLASFKCETDAKKAADQVKRLGIEVAQIAELHAVGNRLSDRDSYLISGEIPSLAAITLNANPRTRDISVMMATDPSASGMADRSDIMAERNYLLTVVCPDEQVEEVVAIIKSCDGYT